VHTPDSSHETAQSKPVALFVSDVHLQAALPKTTEAFLGFLSEHVPKSLQLYLLGDLFEYWAGDDDLSSPEHQPIVDAIRKVANAGIKVFWIGGNRDFLVSQKFAAAAGLTLLTEPSVIDIAGRRIVLLHGDAQCTDDQAYMAFRSQVRNSSWQQNFLSMPLAQRKSIIDGMRSGSREAQRSKSYEIMDVNANAIASVFEATDADLMIHGHTHRPATHIHQIRGQQRVRHVLPDWDCDANSPRGGWLAVQSDGAVARYRYDGVKE
jgi:UDP-2,3-diacylglucosamine hydrolase